MRKKLISILLVIMACCLVISGCNAKIPETTANALPAPQNITYNDATNTISWSQVDNATGYYVQINNNNAIGKLDTNSYVIPVTTFNNNTEFTVAVKACGNGITTTDSAWHTNSSAFYYTKKEQINMTDAFYSMGLGRPINYITASEYQPMGTFIFDTQKLSELKPFKYVERKVNTSSYSGSSLATYLNQASASTSAKMSSNISAGFDIGNWLSFGASISSSIEMDASFESQKESALEQFYYHNEQKIELETVSLPSYQDTRIYSEMLSDKFLEDATLVNAGTMSAKDFIRLYGTHVMMSVIRGGVVSIDYQEIALKDSFTFKGATNVASEITTAAKAGLFDGNAGAGASGGSQTSIQAAIAGLTSYATNEKSTYFNVKSCGGVPKDVCLGMAQFADAYSGWTSSVTTETARIIDVPDNSLYCVWHYLDNVKYANAIRILDEYFMEQCANEYNKFANKFARFIKKDIVSFDEETQVLTIDLYPYQANGSVPADDYLAGGSYAEKLYERTPSYNGKPIKKVIIKGGNNLESVDNTGNIVENKYISNFSIKFTNSWRRDFEIVLDSVGLKREGYTQPIIDLRDISKDYKVTITLVGDNYLGGGTVNTNLSNAIIVGNNIEIKGDGNLTVQGSNGKSEAESAEKLGINGGSAISATNLTINTKGEVTLYGGNGGQGGKGATGEQGYTGQAGSDSISPTYPKAEPGYPGGQGYQGKTGYRGGDGAVAVLTKEFNYVSGTVKIIGGNGGKGGDGGIGGTGGTGGTGGSDRNNNSNGGWFDKDKNDDDDAANGGNGGQGGKGGTGGVGGKGSVAIVTSNGVYTSNYITIINGQGGKGGNGGNGGAGGQGGNAGNRGSEGPVMSNGALGAKGVMGDIGASGESGYCPVKKIGNNSYILFVSNKPWKEAKEYCESLGGHLATITTQEEQELIVSMVSEANVRAYIGGTDAEQEGEWTWVTGEPWNWDLVYFPANQPDDSKVVDAIKGEDYLEIQQNGNWNDMPGTDLYSFVCEWEA